MSCGPRRSKESSYSPKLWERSKRGGAPLGEVTGQRVFVVHSEEASEALGALARNGHRLVRVMPGSGSTGAGLKGSWLVFEASE
jgi:hypothetical protein